jgi:hypothetical protein
MMISGRLSGTERNLVKKAFVNRNYPENTFETKISTIKSVKFCLLLNSNQNESIKNKGHKARRFT